MDQHENIYKVYGEITIPFYFETLSTTEKEALEKVGIILNKRSIELIEATVHTHEGKEHLLIAKKCSIKLHEALGENDI
ncbi:hypothetical protein GCM10023310_70280 [Paenibacillus vulneris]|uniref:Uncharacterized protein n=1 Tax=Paenibacillus vulneris TaxID=1133364 RepID=A0ABW3UG87_9BACL